MTNTFLDDLYHQNCLPHKRFPDKHLLFDFAEQLFSFLFTTDPKSYKSKEEWQRAYDGLSKNLKRLIVQVELEEQKAQRITEAFFRALEEIYPQLLVDATTIAQFDPAAVSIDEVFIAYPGFFATAIYRFAHQLHSQKAVLIARLLSEYAHSKTGIDIHPAAVIGSSFFIDHGTGIVIGESATIGNNVKIYQGVTLGALSVAKELASQKRHPTIMDNVTIYSGATILGGKTIVGENSIIGGNVWLTKSVEPNSIVYHKSEIIVRDKNPLPESLDFII